jgi:hypothetical protein
LILHGNLFQRMAELYANDFTWYKPVIMTPYIVKYVKNTI